MIVWRRSPLLINDQLDVMNKKIQDGLQKGSQELAKQMKGHMQSNAPWADQTGEARAGLDAIVEASATTVTIMLVHGASHGIFLEMGTRNMAPRPILSPTYETFASRVLQVIGSAIAL